jgi:Fic family protein
VLIEDSRFVEIGLRSKGVFLGERDAEENPLPEFIGAKPQDLPSLMHGIVEANTRMQEGSVHPVLQAAALAFAFVYIHPFQDGNGRVHRCLIHHVLAERTFSPPGIVFPVSTVMLERIDAYRDALQAHSRPLMPFIEWRPTPDRNVEVLNDTADLYRYIDCTKQAEFLFACVQQTVEKSLPQELDFLRRHDRALRRIMETVEMPDDTARRLVGYIRQNNGRLGKNRREGEFRALTDAEVSRLESIVIDTFDIAME